MGAAVIQAEINQAFGDAAVELGEPCTVVRPYDPLSAPADQVGLATLKVWFNPDYAFNKTVPNLYNKPLFGALCDRTILQVGDYLFAGSGTYFVIAMQPLLSTAAVQFNRTISITRAGGEGVSGVQPYGGRSSATDVPIMAGWPASVLDGGRSQSGRADLPSDVAMKGKQALLPALPDVIIRTSDRVTDDIGNAFVVSAAELTDLGWRLELTESGVT